MTVEQAFFEEHRERYAQAYASGVLVPEEHYRLVEDLDRVAADAGVLPGDVCSRLSERCHEVQVEFVREFRRWRGVGLIYEGNWPDLDLEARAMVGALVRNFIPARFVLAEDLVSRLFDGEEFDHDALFIPDFAEQGARVTAARSQMVGGLIGKRLSGGLKTVLGAASMPVVQTGYGDSLRRTLERRFERVQA